MAQTVATAPTSWMRYTQGLDSREIFQDRTSVALLGLPGAGKSTLGVIASATLKMRLVETDRCFRTMTGTTTSEYVVQFGRQSYLDKSLEILRHILKKHSTNCVIAVSAKMSDIPACRAELQEFAATHPLVHILRKAEYIVEHLNNHMSRDDVLLLYQRCIPQYRALCNFEFYNGGGAELAGLPSHDASPMPSFLSLKHAQKDFLGFISRIRGFCRLNRFVRAPEDTEFSRVLLIPFPPNDNQDDSSDPRAIHGIHLIQLQLSLQQVLEVDLTSLLDRISFVLARFRRNCDYPVALRVLPLPILSDRSALEYPNYFRVLQHGVSLGFDYCYVDLGLSHHSLAQFTQHAGATKIIGTWHNYGQPSPQSSLWKTNRYQDVFDLAVDLGCSAVQLSAPAATMQDNYDVMKFTEKMRQQGAQTKVQISAFNTGEIGRLSRIMNRTLSPVAGSHFLAHNHYHEEQTLHGGTAELAGIITVEESCKALEAAFIVRKLRFCSFGSLISHSIAPAMHNAALSALGLPYHYGLVQSPDVIQSLHLMRACDFGGLSCANPHKRSIITHLDHISDAARDITAVNTVYTVPLSSGGRALLVGENTDWIGVTSCIENYLSPVNTITSKTTALVLGAGGMAHAAVYGLLRLGVTRIFLWNRTLSRAEALKQHFRQVGKSLQFRRFSSREDDVLSDHNCNDDAQDSGPVEILPSTEPSQISDRGVAYPSLIINTLADGSDQPVASAFDLDADWFSNETGGVYVESAYRSVESVLRSKVQGLMPRNWVAVRGQELLLEQAFPQIELWTGMPAPRDIMRRAVNL
ncbi:unnamed protein product [Clonostachys byssicola]|uniref:Quinate repressor protein n=1 Tax=Clonostachys byssicola TaxID=160290 RepID=A0A9N9Y391_9HYPO|nr:unnamed protein product [Clonostachys byssicola]